MKMNHKQRKKAIFRLTKKAKRETNRGNPHLVNHLVKLVLRLRNMNFHGQGRCTPRPGFRDFVRVRPQVARLTVDQYIIKRLNRYWKGKFNALRFANCYDRKPMLATGASLTHSDEHFKRTWLGRRRGGKHRNTDVKADVNTYTPTVEAPTPKKTGILGKAKNWLGRKRGK